MLLIISVVLVNKEFHPVEIVPKTIFATYKLKMLCLFYFDFILLQEEALIFESIL